jgi:threonine/homoserine/homoserine lactone efflux protein
VETALVIQFALTAALFAVMPGADWAYAIGAGLRPRSIVPPILGLASGYVLVVTVIAVGVGALVTANPDILTVLTVIGAAYIIWLGVSTLLELRGGTGSLVPGADGTGVSSINPKGLMLLLALLPQFLTDDGWPSGIQMGLLGGIFILEILVVYSGVAVAARALLADRPRLATAVSVVSGIFLTGFGTWLLLDALF